MSALFRICTRRTCGLLLKTLKAHAATEVERSKLAQGTALRSLTVTVSPPVKPMDVINDPTLLHFLRLAGSHTRLPAKASPVAQGVEYIMARHQLSQEHLEAGMTDLADQFIDNCHCLSVEEVCAWCEICRRLNFAGTRHNGQGLADAVCGALKGRMHQLEANQLASVAWLLAHTHAPLPSDIDEELTDEVTCQCRSSTADDVVYLTDAAESLSNSRHASTLLLEVSRAAARCIPLCPPSKALHVASAPMYSALPADSAERHMLVKSLAISMVDNTSQYSRDGRSLQRALDLIRELADGHAAYKEYLLSAQRCARHIQDSSNSEQPTTSGATEEVSCALPDRDELQRLAAL